ncbi:MAG: guanylate kinase [Lachnospiraceae bacterium]|nr:guanylate kinase [Lachnospiraceae bacterium]MBO7338899.1 guanylate kinase [Lachnospiraceae bacterium]MBP5265062.1 guanylate kinase [Lachnospiraceae bacterium]
MGKIVCLMGKSSTGKDTIYKELLKRKNIAFRTVVPYTTRPIRAGEQEGVEYHFTDEEGFQALKAQGKIIEDRAYNTCHGLWRYFTVDDGKIAQGETDDLLIGTLEAYQKLVAYFGAEKVLPVYVALDDGVRLQRALDREKKQEQPKYEEMCRRFLADSEDFSAEKLKEAGNPKSFYNDNLDECINEIEAYLRANL